ncbi:MAG: V-type ATP synthase subunit E [Bacillota bacterium]|nr:V-type ATP synthase subunit E [Bacillota bacterium]
MEGISKILDAISREGSAAADKILENGRHKADEIKNYYDKEAHAAADKKLREAEKSAEEVKKRFSSQAGAERRSIRLEARRKALGDAFDKAGKKLAELSKNDKKRLYEKIIERSGCSGEVIIMLNAEDKKILGGRIKPDGIKIRIDESTGDFTGGLVIRQENTEIKCTFEAMIESARGRYEAEIAEVLFS